jgi:arsenate reductase (thioredoxin)
MREVDIDLADARPRHLHDDLAATATLLVTMGCGEACPTCRGSNASTGRCMIRRRPLEGVREIRDDTRARVAALVDARGWRKI